VDFRRHGVNLIYGTIRFVERDDESFLSWARNDTAGIIFNLHTEHTPQGLEHSAGTFRRLIDLAIRYEGSYYLTYHRYATAEQVMACYPRFADFLDWKRRCDPSELFQSDWYRRHARLLGQFSRGVQREPHAMREVAPRSTPLHVAKRARRAIRFYAQRIARRSRRRRITCQ